MTTENKIKCKNRIISFYKEKIPAYPDIEPRWLFKYTDELYSILISENLISNINYLDFTRIMQESLQFEILKQQMGTFNVTNN